MKKVLSLLVAFVFLQTQTWALSGGPFQTTVGANIIGTYAGVMLPAIAPAVAPAGAAAPAASIGLFSFAQPQTGLATGALLIFVNGTAFAGTITGLIDPEDGKLSAVIDAQSNINTAIAVVAVPGGAPAAARPQQGFAQGNLTAQIKTVEGLTNGLPTPGSVTATSSNLAIGLNASRITGTATVAVFFSLTAAGAPVVSSTTSFTVSGFKQADTATTGTATNALTGFGGG
jgi:hypothetical protein